MPKFVPVSDPERPRNEQSEFDPAFRIHRKFDNPHAAPFGTASVSSSAPLSNDTTKNKTNDRGWGGGGVVGWGVRGFHGDASADDGSHIDRSRQKSKMIMVDGKWVKASKLKISIQDKKGGMEIQEGQQMYLERDEPLQRHRNSNQTYDDLRDRDRERDNRGGKDRTSYRGRDRNGCSYENRDRGRERGYCENEEKKNHRDESRDKDRYEGRGRDYGRDCDRHRNRNGHDRSRDDRIRNDRSKSFDRYNRKPGSSCNNRDEVPNKRKKKFDPEWGVWR